METFTTREAARLLGVSRRTFNRWIESHPVERETGYGPSGVEYKYTRAALEHILRQVRGEGAASQLVDGSPEGEESEPAQGRQGVSSRVGQDETAAQMLAIPLTGQVEEFLTLLADVRDVVARASAGEGRATAAVEEVATLREEVHQLREVLAARLPGPPAPPSPPPRFRPCVVAEVVLLGWVGLLVGVLGVVVLQRLADVGVVTLPAWWPIG